MCGQHVHLHILMFLCASLLPNSTTHWLAQYTMSLCSTCGALWECCELCDLHFCPHVRVLPCVVLWLVYQDMIHSHVCVCTSLCSTCDALCKYSILCYFCTCCIPSVYQPSPFKYVLCSLCFCTRLISCVPTFLQIGRDCFLLACQKGHEEIVRDLFTKYKVDQNVVDEVRN